MSHSSSQLNKSDTFVTSAPTHDATPDSAPQATPANDTVTAIDADMNDQPDIDPNDEDEFVLPDLEVGIPEEDEELYRRGGLHPTRIGEVLHGRYEILNKLGFGAYSTVWIARDLTKERNVSVKIVTAENSVEGTEIRVLRHLRDQPEHPGKRHILTLLDDFYHEGPNGRHLCLVTDIIGPMSHDAEDDYGTGVDKEVGKRLTRQMLTAIDFLHKSGVAHGDIYTGNILTRLDKLTTMSREELKKELGEPERVPVTRRSGKPLEPEDPEYTVCTVRYNDAPATGDENFVLIDFGSAFFLKEVPGSVNTPTQFMPPEVALRKSLTKQIDIWNLGVTVYEIHCGRSLFENIGSSRSALLLFINRQIGGLPIEWIDNAIANEIIDPIPPTYLASHPNTLEKIATLRRWNGITDDELFDLIAFLRKALVVCPEGRASVKELLDCRWLTDGA